MDKQEQIKNLYDNEELFSDEVRKLRITLEATLKATTGNLDIADRVMDIVRDYGLTSQCLGIVKGQLALVSNIEDDQKYPAFCGINGI